MRISLLNDETVTSELTFKKVKVSDKGQISLPMEIQREVGIKKGDELLLIRKGQKIVLEKPRRIVKALEDEFAELQDISEASLRRMWLRKKEDIWDRYLEASIK
ncbi:MAG: AbrB/MazE/SpoVT family DNA-binding domain-containing protein [Candidatus Bathyarchaeia archaeon]